MAQRFGTGVNVSFLMPVLIQRKKQSIGWWLVIPEANMFEEVHLRGVRDSEYMASVTHLIQRCHGSHEQDCKPRLVFAGYSAGGYAAIALADYFGFAWWQDRSLPPVFAVVAAAAYGEGSIPTGNEEDAVKFRAFVDSCVWNFWWVKHVVILHAKSDTLSKFDDMKLFFDCLQRSKSHWHHVTFQEISDADASGGRSKKRKRYHSYFPAAFCKEPGSGGSESFELLSR